MNQNHEFSKYKRILILTGEVSGDLHGGYLVKSLKKLSSDIKVFAVGSNHLKDAGAVIIKDIAKDSTIGFLETLKNIPMLYILKNKLINILKEHHIDLLICVDFQGFNMILAKKAKLMGIPVAYYIPPQEWVWGTEKGVKRITETTDKIVTIFQEEFDAYKKHTNNVRFFGHPLVQMIEENKLPTVIDKDIISVFPGSRKQEIKYCFPEMLRIIRNLHLQNTNQKFVINLPNTTFQRKVENKIKKMKDYVSITIGDTYQVLSKSKFALVTSGTITLECLLMGAPHAIFYKFNPISFLIINNYLKKKFKFDNYSLTNILAGKEIVPEYLQKFNTKLICRHIIDFLSSEQSGLDLKNEFKKIKTKLAGKEHKNTLLEISKYLLS